MQDNNGIINTEKFTIKPSFKKGNRIFFKFTLRREFIGNNKC